MNQIEITNEDINSWHPLFVVPCYDQQITQSFFLSFIELVKQAEKIGLKYDLLTLSDSLISRSRNRAVQYFLSNKEYTHLFFIDADTEFSFESVIKLLWANKDVIGGAPPFKCFYNGKLKFVVNFEKNPKNATVDRDFIKVHDIGTGFTLIKRSVFNSLIEKYPELKYEDDFNKDIDNLYNFFNPHIDPIEKRYLSEGHAFCRYWREIGGEIWIDPTIEMGHLGRFMYKGTLANLDSHNVIL